MSNFSILIAGCGYVGTALSQLCERQHGSEAAVYGLRRNPSGLPTHVKPLPADLGDPALAHRLPEVNFDYVVICAAPDHSNAEAYTQLYVAHTRNLLAALSQKGVQPRKLIFTSSTAVYAQDHGEVVDEKSAATANHFRATRASKGNLPRFNLHHSNRSLRVSTTGSSLYSLSSFSIDRFSVDGMWGLASEPSLLVPLRSSTSRSIIIMYATYACWV